MSDERGLRRSTTKEVGMMSIRLAMVLAAVVLLLLAANEAGWSFNLIGD